MMPSLHEIGRGVRGAWLIFRFEPAGLWQFDLTIPGFWRSFWAPVLMLPVYGGLLALLAGTVDAALVLDCVGYLAMVALWPLVTAVIARSFGLTAHYVPYIIATNWASVISLLLQIPAALMLVSAGDKPGFVVLALWFTTQVVTFGYQFLVARVAFNAPAGLAAALVLLELLMTLAVDYLFALLA
jgi:hypothetical protein